MSRHFALILTALMLTAACRDPRCPRNLVQDGNVCRRCPDGSAVKNNLCIGHDGGVVEPVMEEDEDAQSGEWMDEPDASQADANSALPGKDAGPSEPRSDAASMDSTVDGASSEASTEQDARASDANSNDDATSIPVDSGADASVDAGPPCYADNDKDGVGAGAPVSCEGFGTDAGPSLSMTNTDCDDNNNKRSPSLTDICGDNIDNDCDGTPDDEANNACGGPCTTQLAHQPGEKCDNGLKGACVREGTWQCQGKTATVCNAPSAAAGSEVCGDGVDNDCDGSKDEEDAIDAPTWYRDCDNDGYGVLASTTSCIEPASTGNCLNWIMSRPEPKLTEDCDDYSTSYHPGAQRGYATAGNPSGDMNCDGRVQFDKWVTWFNPDSPFFANIAYVCDPGLECRECWTQACTGVEGFSCWAAQFLEERRCSRGGGEDLPVRVTTNGGCTTWSTAGSLLLFPRVSQACL